jgi:signal transduction histidine kinase
MWPDFVSLFENTPQIAFLLTAKGAVQQLNPAAQLFLAELADCYSLDGETWLQGLFTPELLITLEVEKKALLIESFSDHNTPFFLTFSSVTTPTGAFILLLIEPIHQALLAPKQKAISELLYIISHDLKSPLIAIQGFSEVLQEECQQPNLDLAIVRQYLEYIINGAQNLSQFFSSLAELGRVYQNVTANTLVPLNEIVDAAITKLSFYLQSRAVKLSVTPDLPIVLCDRLQLIKVFYNLLENAIKFTPADRVPEIEIGYQQCISFHRILIRDNGIGIDPSLHKRIFSLFHRANTLETEGLGVGLTVTKQIIEAHNGFIWVESAKATGSCFYIALPIDSNQWRLNDCGTPHINRR